MGKRREEQERKKKVIGYLRVSTDGQNNEKNKAAILDFANERDLGKVEWAEDIASGKIPWKQRKLGQVVEDLQAGDIVIVSELSRLGRSMMNVIEVLSVLKNKGVSVYALKGNWSLDDDTIQSKVVLMMFSMMSEIERDLLSARTKEGMEARRRSGKPMGRPKGPGKSRLSPFEPEIIGLLKNGSPKTYVAQRYHVSPATLSHYLKRRQIDANPIRG